MKTQTTPLSRQRWLFTTVSGLALAACMRTGDVVRPASADESPGAHQAAEVVRAPIPAEMAEQKPVPVLAGVRARGRLRCGVHPDWPGFSTSGTEPNRRDGFNIDLCRALAAAVLGDAQAIELVAVEPADSLPTLLRGEIDVLFYPNAWTLTRDAGLGLELPAIMYFERLAYLVRDDQAGDWDTSGMIRTCVRAGFLSEQAVAADLTARGVGFELLALPTERDVRAGLQSGDCSVAAGSETLLAGWQAAEPGIYERVLTESRLEPQGPVVAAGDEEWRDVVAWTMYALIEAEALGINQANVMEFAASQDPEVQRLLGTGDDDLGARLGLSSDYAFQEIQQVGSYEDIYIRHLIPLGIQRQASPNRTWVDGGLLFSPLFR